MQKRGSDFKSQKNFSSSLSLSIVSFFNLCFILDANSFASIHNTFRLLFYQSISRKRMEHDEKINAGSREIIYKIFNVLHSHNNPTTQSKRNQGFNAKHKLWKLMVGHFWHVVALWLYVLMHDSRSNIFRLLFHVARRIRRQLTFFLVDFVLFSFLLAP